MVVSNVLLCIDELTDDDLMFSDVLTGIVDIPSTNAEPPKKKRKSEGWICSLCTFLRHASYKCPPTCNKCRNCSNRRYNILRCSLRRCATCCECPGPVYDIDGMVASPPSDHTIPIVCENPQCTGTYRWCRGKQQGRLWKKEKVMLKYLWKSKPHHTAKHL